jgi:hypothetical protein
MKLLISIGCIIFSLLTTLVIMINFPMACYPEFIDKYKPTLNFIVIIGWIIFGLLVVLKFLRVI